MGTSIRMGMLALATVAGLGGCDDGTAPDVLPEDRYELPEPDPSLDPARLTLGTPIATPCGRDTPGVVDDLLGRDEWALVDVFFGRASGGPTLAERLDVMRQDGQVLYSFNVPAVRAWILLSRVPALVAEGAWTTVWDVPDARRYDLRVSVSFDRPVSTEDVAVFESLGGRVDVIYEAFPGLGGALPDRSISTLRALSGVTAVEHGGQLFCLL